MYSKLVIYQVKSARDFPINDILFIFELISLANALPLKYAAVLVGSTGAEILLPI
jgi:hypothetical protein